MIKNAYGITDNDLAAWAVLLADLNGDGRDDLVILSRQADGLNDLGPVNSGEVYIRFGSPTYPTTQDLSVAPADVTIYAAGIGDFPRRAASGDLNDDGIDDLIFSAPGADGPSDARDSGGEVYVLYGRAIWPSVIELVNPDPATTSADVTIFGEEEFDRFGSSLAIGDVNGDLIDDLIVGALGLDRGSGGSFKSDVGGAYVFYGGALEPIYDLNQGGSAPSPDVKIEGQDENDAYGTSLAVGVTGTPLLLL